MNNPTRAYQIIIIILLVKLLHTHFQLVSMRESCGHNVHSQKAALLDALSSSLYAPKITENVQTAPNNAALSNAGSKPHDWTTPFIDVSDPRVLCVLKAKDGAKKLAEQEGFCIRSFGEHSVNPGKNWGTLPENDQLEWNRRRCDDAIATFCAQLNSANKFM